MDKISEMASPKLVRFSLRTLFVLLTIFCGLLGYGANWKYQRRAFLAEHTEDFQTVNPQLTLWSDELKAWGLRLRAKVFALSLVGESKYYRIRVVVPSIDTTERHSTRDSTVFVIAKTQTDYARARRLFPEAIINPYVREKGGLMPVAVISDAADTIANLHNSEYFLKDDMK
jgi:hypothetical protein